jgi:hypothetical protein
MMQRHASGLLVSTKAMMQLHASGLLVSTQTQNDDAVACGMSNNC